METTLSDAEAPRALKRGGWITFPIITATVAGLTLCAGGWISNLLVYLIEEFNVKSIDATQITNIVNGTWNLIPVLGAIIADSLFGCYFVVSISSCISLLSLRPPPCDTGSTSCTGPSKTQYAALFMGIALAATGLGGTRFTIATMGADQFDKPRDQEIFFNWYFFTLYVTSIVSATALVYVEDNVSWVLGFSLCALANLIGLAIFLSGTRFYRHVKPQGSPFTGLARVLVATVRKWKVPVSSIKEESYYQGQDEASKAEDAVEKAPSNSFRFLNRAALKTQGDTNPDGSIAKPWSLCTVQQVEDLKSLLRIFPLWSSSIFLSATIGIQGNLTILQALSMDRRLGPHLKIPAGSIIVFVLISTAVTLAIVDRVLCPAWQKLTGLSPTPLQRIGLGHVLNLLGMAVSGLVETKRLNVAHSHNVQVNMVVPMLAAWLFPQLALVGVGEAFHFPGQVSLYYQEFPASLKGTSTAMISVLVAVGFYLSTALVDLVRRVTGWLPDNINHGRLDNVYWLLTAVAAINFGTVRSQKMAWKPESYTLAQERGFGLNKMETTLSDAEAPRTLKRGGWITFPIITAATVAGLTLCAGGWIWNLPVYLIEEFNVKSIDATQITNIVNGTWSLIPVLGAIIADSLFGCYLVVSISSFISLLGTLLITLTAALKSLRPPPCANGSASCTGPSKIQYAVLFMGIVLAVTGVGGTRFTIATMGADQFDEPRDQEIFFNWYFFTLYVTEILSATALVYVEDNVSWVLGFGLCALVNLIGLAIFLSGTRFYRHVKPQGSPFTGLARVLVATVRKWKVPISSMKEEYYYQGLDEASKAEDAVEIAPSKSFRFLNRAALKTQGDTNPDGSIAKPWSLCTVQHVEDLKSLLRIFPLWSSGIFLSITIGIQSNLTILQALSMDRRLGPLLKIPAGSITVFVLISTAVTLAIVDRVLCPAWQKLTGLSPTPLQRIGLGHVLNLLGMAVSGLVETKRLKVAHSHNIQPNMVVPMLAVWLFPQLALVGVGVAFHFPGQVSLYYQEFPASLKGTSTAMISVLIGVGFYLSTALVDLVRRVTGWLPDNINDGRLDNVYWLLTAIAAINFGYYVVCARWYKYRNT
ncbi:Proton-dependent oligopeptide transporter family [Dillenia turbinata]|uniref:Proton-dependent oligopeptide transporter family n=1 Tax=Dillenia turbinata TaxID=194707 RepID=A0AAN8VYV6_9MAGN